MKKSHRASCGFTLIEVLIVIGIIAILAAVVLVAVNPGRQFKQARDSQRTSNVNAILNAIGQYVVDHKGDLPASIGTTAQVIKKSGGVDLCADLVPTYIPALPADPANGASVTDCAAAYDTGYRVNKDANGRILVSAVGEVTASISVQR